MPREKIQDLERVLATLRYTTPDELTDELLAELFAPEVEWRPVAQQLRLADRYVGYEGMRRFFADFLGVWDEFDAHVEGLREVGDHVITTLHVTGHRHGASLDETWSALWTLENHRVVRMEGFANPIGAHGALGLARDTAGAMSDDMSPDQAEAVVRRLFQCGNRRAYDALERLFHSESLLDLSRQGLGTYEGAEAIRAFCESWIEVYDSFELTAVELLELGGVVVLTVNRHRGRPRGSSATVVLENAWVFVCQDGLIQSWTAYDDTQGARAAAEALAATGN